MIEDKECKWVIAAVKPVLTKALRVACYDQTDGDFVLEVVSKLNFADAPDGILFSNRDMRNVDLPADMHVNEQRFMTGKVGFIVSRGLKRCDYCGRKLFVLEAV